MSRHSLFGGFETITAAYKPSWLNLAPFTLHLFSLWQLLEYVCYFCFMLRSFSISGATINAYM